MSSSSVPKPIAPPGRAPASGQMGPLSELENALDVGGEGAQRAASEALVRVRNLAERSRLAIAKGVDRNEYDRLASLENACKIAVEILGSYEPKVHPDARMHLRQRLK